MEITLHKPIEKDGQTIGKVTLNLETLKGRHLVEAEQEARLRGNVSVNPLYTEEGKALVAAKASGLIVDDILDLAAPDFMRITTEVNIFLHGMGLPMTTPSESSEKQS
ncbi:phage tail assembly protein [Brevibacillus sp. H7]|uniref:phage tail assembly protein n=1 Tax=Brevibacillus sp. H7 TaxID=3349138 RepID=UPI0037F9E699